MRKRKLWLIDAATEINDLRVPPSNHLEKFVDRSAAKASKGVSTCDLAIRIYFFAKQIVKLHNGQIGVASPGVNKGSTFWFKVPKRGRMP